MNETKMYMKDVLFYALLYMREAIEHIEPKEQEILDKQIAYLESLEQDVIFSEGEMKDICLSYTAFCGLRVQSQIKRAIKNK